jgi:integrase
VTAGTEEKTGGRPWQLSAEARALLEKFPPRAVPASWPATRQPRGKVVARLLAPPFEAATSQDRCNRKLALLKVLDWLELHPGRTWQERWEHATAGDRDWRDVLIRELSDAGNPGPRGGRLFQILGPGVTQLITADVIRPSLGWLMTTASPQRIANETERVRDPAGFARLREVRDAGTFGNATVVPALEKVALILAAKGGTVSDITVGDCLELVRTSRDLFPGPSRSSRHSPFFYQVLHAAGIFPAAAPPTVRMFSSLFAGQLTVGQMVDRYDLACRPVRDLLVDYLRERQPGIDYNTLTTLATTLALSFWKDLETHHRGISSLRLPPDIAAAWKQRLRIKPVRGAAGRDGATEERKGATDILITVRAFYLDLSQWALDDPARWGPWAVPCPVRAGDVQYRKMASRRKARMDQRTRERLPVMPALAAAADQNRRDAAARLKAAAATEPGGTFTAAGVTLRRAVLQRPSPRVWAEDQRDGKRRDLTREEDNTFWAWAAVEALRLTGIRIEELTELSHHSLVQYRVPSSGELVPLLSVAPSKTDEERLLVVAPELADVLSAVICRIRDPGGSVPLAIAYDQYEKTWNPPMPLLFQHRVGLEDRPIPISGIRTLITRALAAAGITGTDGKPLDMAPHDFRRVFATEAILNGMPPHIAQLILGHKDINTTMGYKAVYPGEAINGHRAFLARRRALRPSEEYRTPSDAEWDEFLGHFERRKLALGDCGRAYGSSCIHEMSCVRCPLLRIDPVQRGRLADIHGSLLARIAEAEREGWTGEAEGLKVSLAAAEAKLAQADGLIARRAAAVDLGIPAYRDIAATAAAIPETDCDR